MPETAFSMQRIKMHLRRWIGLYLAGMIALCFLNHLVYTVTRPGFSDDERLKVMLLNVDFQLSDEEYAALSLQLLPEIQKADDGILTLEFEPLAGAAQGNPASDMLLSAKLIGGFGDIYLCDRYGYELLGRRGALQDLGKIQIDGWESIAAADTETGKTFTGGLRLKHCRLTGGEINMAVAANGTDIDSAMAALRVIANALKE